MNIDDLIYVNHPDLIGLDDAKVDYADLDETMDRDAEGAAEITVLGGYYNADALVRLCMKVPRKGRRGCTVRVAIGLESTALIPRTWEELRAVERRLRKAGFRDVTVSVVLRASTHFHTKLFRILRTTRPVWYVGPANPGSRRRELMVRLTGRHVALTAYVEAVFARARSVSAPSPQPELRTLRDFFLSGMLCHKPPVQRLFTFEAFRFTPEGRDRLTAILAGDAGAPHARPRTEGLGFSLRSAPGVEEFQAPEDDGAAQRVQYRRSCVETVLSPASPPSGRTSVAAAAGWSGRCSRV